MSNSLLAVILGIIEGLTEFLPVSSTAHLLIAEQALGFHAPGQVFPIVIQFGAILAVVAVHWRKFLDVLVGLPVSRDAQHFTLTVLIAFAPSVVAGLLLHSFIKSVLFSPGVAAPVIAFALITGGILILVLERMRPMPRFSDGDRLPYMKAFQIGLCQVLAIFPGVSRSGATIMGALLVGVERRAAAEFSFLLAIPTMLAATAYDLYKNRDVLTTDNLAIIAVGFITAFLVAFAVVRTVLGFISKHGYTPFAIYRIVIGVIMLAVLTLRT